MPSHTLEMRPPALPDSLRDLLDDFRREQGLEVRLWLGEADSPVLLTPQPSGATLRPGPGAVRLPIGGEGEIRLEVVGASAEEADRSGRFLATVVRRLLQHDAEVRAFSREMAERYEEITLLYSISEILGSVISLEEGAGTILSEVIGTIGAERATLWVHDAEQRVLGLAAAVGGEGQSGPIAVDDTCSVTAKVFRDRTPLILEPGDEFPRGQCGPSLHPRGSFLSVPMSYTPPEGETRTIGVINLIGKTSGEPFSAGDQKLVSAIASQIGAAVENNRLVAETLKQERMVREMELAHDLQLKLLSSVEQFRGFADVSARCVPAESVGGDFYQLFRLPGGRLGVVIGDVSSHGFAAALIMALTMSAVAIHASEGDPPAEVLRLVHSAIIQELETTEMYLTLFYGVIDPQEGVITYANAGHAHAFRVDAGGRSVRLGATSPPLGIVDLAQYAEAQESWVPGEDLLFLFTDGLPDALEQGEIAGERILLEEVSRGRTLSLDQLMERLFALEGIGDGHPGDDRTAVLLRT